ncbi:MAG: hypothetical protein J0M15_01340 [Deltaproteobacteria bacterium]|nr:hypothetical protein [Deltaproteobacteria bacterium]
MNSCLIRFQFSTLDSKDKIKAFIQDFKSKFDIEKVSSVFKRRTNKLSDLYDLQEFVAKVRTTIPSMELKVKINIQKLNSYNSFKIELLAYDGETKITPQLTLPHPNLYLDSLILHCSAEIWPEYIHPIYRKTLKTCDLERNIEGLDFLYQGKFFLD